MNVTLTLDDELAKRIAKIAADRGTTLAALIHSHLLQLAAEADSGDRQRALETLERSFQELDFKVGKRTWTRADLYDRR